jgi:SpoVK/Ycf46/Vps4 family AAA+-type ATPase
MRTHQIIDKDELDLRDCRMFRSLRRVLWRNLSSLSLSSIQASSISSSHSLSQVYGSSTSPSTSFSLLLSLPLILLINEYSKKLTQSEDHSFTNISSPSSSSSSKIFTKEELKVTLQKKIANLKTMSSRPIQLAVRFDGKLNEECHIVELTNIHPSSILEMIATTIPILSPADQSATVELHSIGNDNQDGRILSLISSLGDRSLSISGKEACALSVFKDGGFSSDDVETIIKAYKIASSTKLIDLQDDYSLFQLPRQANSSPSLPQQQIGKKKKSKEEAVSKLESMGINIFTTNDPVNSEIPSLNWESLAGYQHVKREIKNTILTPLLHPEVYDNITKYTRESFESNRPKAVLLEGPPGTGKTLTARIIAQESSKTMIHIPLEAISSKWYGESEKRIAEIFDCCDALGGTVIFIDEIDSVVGSRDQINQMHEASRRILSIILQRIEGFIISSKNSQNILICATNRKSDLDIALLSRFDVIIQYSLPDYETRKAVFKKYAKQLGRLPLHNLAELSQGMSNRDIKEICEYAERSWASKMIEQADRTGIQQGLPTSSDYLESLEIRKKAKIMNSSDMLERDTKQ